METQKEIDKAIDTVKNYFKKKYPTNFKKGKYTIQIILWRKKDFCIRLTSGNTNKNLGKQFSTLIEYHHRRYNNRLTCDTRFEKWERKNIDLKTLY